MFVKWLKYVPTNFNMYNFEFVSKYKQIEQEYIEKKYEEKEVEMLCDELYRCELLQIFNMLDLELPKMNEVLDNVWDQLKGYSPFYKCVQTFKSKCIFDDDILAFTMLFNYDSLYIVHACISDFLKCNIISPINLTNLEKFVNG